jgi:hypothetical protein
MKQLESLSQLTAESLRSDDPKINGGPFNGAWRALALGLLEYRKGNWAAAESWFQRSINYRDPLQSHTILVQILLGLTHRRLGKSEVADSELESARQQVQRYFDAKLRIADSQTGQLQDWIIARILLREAAAASGTRADSP